MGQFEKNNKNKNKTHGVILASDLLGRCCQQEVAAVPSWMRQVFGFLSANLALSMAMSKYKAKWSYNLIPCACIDLIFLCPGFYPLVAHFSSRERLTAVTHTTFTSACPCLHGQLPLHGNFSLTVVQDFKAWQGCGDLLLLWVKTLSLGVFFCHRQCWIAGTDGTLTSPGENEGPDQPVEVLRNCGWMSALW